MKQQTRKPSPRAARTAPHEVRIIGGLWKRTPLPVVDLPGLRPTPVRVRETLFNWLGQDLTGWLCLDAFAGTGALGFEAASRGAAEVVLVEQDAALTSRLSQTKIKLKADALRIERGDGVAALRQRSGRGLDLVFLDPPFADGQNEALYLEALKAARATLNDTGLIYLEAPRLWTADELQAIGLELYKQDRAGAVAFHLLRVLPAA